MVVDILKRKFCLVAVSCIFVLFIAGCGGGGGGGGGGGTPNPQEGSSWNEMYWDQGKWG